MDETIVDFHSHPTLKVDRREFNSPKIYKEGYFLNLKPFCNALCALKLLNSYPEYDVYICTKPLKGSAISYSEKVQWIEKYIPELLGKIIMCQDKTMIDADYLIDDNLEYKEGFKGKFLHFNAREPEAIQWARLHKYFESSRHYL